MKRHALLPWCIAAAVCIVTGAAALVTPVRFSGALLIGVGILLLLWVLLKGKKKLRAVIAILVLIGFLIFAAAEIQVVHYACRKDDRPVSAVIVLGAGVYGTTPSLSLRVRLEAALEYIVDKPDVPIVVSGGQGNGENITEAQCMRDWLVAHGVDEERIWMEERATSTKENIDFSRAVLQEHGIDTTGNIAVVSADYHVYRASLYWGLPWMVPVPATMDGRWWPITVNYFIREAFGVVYLTVFGV